MPRAPQEGNGKLFVANLPYDAADSDLKDFLVKAGYCPTVCAITRDAEGNSRGYGFVEIEIEFCQAAITELHNTTFMGQRIAIEMAREKRERRPEVRA
jgi:RNA recognition motif-containing protein